MREKFGVGPDKVIEVQALCGDSVDNVPGVPGIGVKTAAELINTYGDLENLLEHAPEIKQPKRRESLIEHAAKARLSRELVKLDDHVPLPCPLERPGGQADRPQRAAALAQADGVPHARHADGAAPGGRAAGDGRGGASQRAGRPADRARSRRRRKYALIDTLDGLDRWIEAAEEAGHVAIHPAPGLRRHRAGAGRRASPAMCRSAGQRERRTG